MPHSRRRVQHAALLWSSELALARITSEPLSFADILISAFALLAMALVPQLLADLVSMRRKVRGIVFGIADCLPLALVASGILLPTAYVAYGLRVGLSIVAGIALCLLAYRVARSIRRGDSIPGTRFTMAALAGAACAAWLIRGGGFPPLAMVGACALGWFILAMSMSRPRWVPMGCIGVVVLARLPQPELDVEWRRHASAAVGPDIVLLTIDTLRADVATEMRSYQRILEKGVAFESAQAPAPWTLPSMATLLTGTPLAQHGAGRFPAGGYGTIDEEIVSLASRLSNHGYDTAAVAAPNPFTGAKFGFNRGFAVFDHFSDRGRFALPRIDRIGRSAPVIPGAITYLWAGRRPFGMARELVDRAESILDQRRDRPIFLWLHFLDCHLPYRDVRETDLSWPDRMVLGGLARNRELIVSNPHWRSKEGRSTLIGVYRHEVMRIDRAIEQLLDRLGDPPAGGRGVAMTSDHGEEFFEHEGVEHGHALYQEVIRVPLVLSGLESEHRWGAIESKPVGLIDLATTLLAAAGLEDRALGGQNLSRPIREDSYLCENMLYNEDLSTGALRGDRFSVREGSWKAIFGRSDGVELYHSDEDPNEERDLASEHPEIVARLAERRSRLATLDRSLGALGRHERNALNALGYLAE
ncbi:MAG: hypothetical protein CME06_03995 [Gemmatimonadetes bacterium]|nr:hypothetical protein [Gemmatimonadota bacterium]